MDDLCVRAQNNLECYHTVRKPIIQNQSQLKSLRGPISIVDLSITVYAPIPSTDTKSDKLTSRTITQAFKLL